ncbi:VRR-NUC domain-containing protein [Halotalea alkalilenta]|uniref:phosphodiesterase I n=1 Tax=Halotalea alkalilenta TaxID=376489 RepID=A0A172YBT0_9GAMM|nr:VRR-NUC domain-containing protein [Halotalea alkalilenta]ANF56576.1 hypothetical protein A5892_03070 [Halotalea alkalilenta]
MSHPLEDPLYYLDNFHTLLDWVAGRYGDLLDDDERGFIVRFSRLPVAARALLARMVMRKGELFRVSKLVYPEIEAVGGRESALQALADAGLVDPEPALSLEALFSLLRRAELETFLGVPPVATRKADWCASLSTRQPEPRPLAQWAPGLADRVVELRDPARYDRLRLMFFGNLRQDFSEFVLADLGIYRFERIQLDPVSRGFHHRGEVEDYLRLHRLRDRLEREGIGAMEGEEGRWAVEGALDNPWIEQRRQRLLLAYAKELERHGHSERSLSIYALCQAQGARVRRVRLLERLGRTEAALSLARQAQDAPESAEERQQLSRIAPRLHRRLGLPRPTVAKSAPVESFELRLPRSLSVEAAVRDHLTRPEAPVHYVENGLLNSLFGLLCWEAIFAPISGAFFHPFHTGPADLMREGFVERRRALFDACLAELDDDRYLGTIRRRFVDKQGIQSPFVHWGVLDQTLLERALACLPAAHLKQWCLWLLSDLKRNRAGFPDLIQFWPEQRRYRMVEVKGPGDRLQDNQRRMIAHCLEYDIPVSVCWVAWAEEPR